MPMMITPMDISIMRERKIRKIRRVANAKITECDDEFTEMIAAFVKQHNLSLAQIVFLLTNSIKDLAVISAYEMQKGK